MDHLTPPLPTVTVCCCGDTARPRYLDYLDRIGVEVGAFWEHGPTSLHSLKQVLRHHLHSIPFENVDMHREGCPRALNLHVDQLFDKLVRRGRGGVCFEVNGLMGEMLREMGFQVRYLPGSGLHGHTHTHPYACSMESF